MTDYLTNDTDLTSVADAIREKGGTSEPLEWPTGYVDAIEAIETGGGGGGGYVVSIDESVSQTYWFSINTVVCSEGDTVTVKYRGNKRVMEPMSKIVVSDIDGNTLTVLKSGGTLDANETHTFTMPAQNVFLSISY